MQAFEIREYGWQPADSWRPTTRVTLEREPDAVHLKFEVQDQFVLGRTQEFNGRVWEDSCVEFFFNPHDTDCPYYFNIEVNIAGGILFNRQTGRMQNTTILPASVVDLMDLKVTPGVLIQPESTEPCTWTASYRIPFSILREFGEIDTNTWQGNFYKCAEANSHPHWGSWAPIDLPEPYFHSPQFFREISL